MDIDIVVKIISKSQIPLEVIYYLITGEKQYPLESKILPNNWGKNNIPECYHRTTTLFLGVLSVNAAFLEYMVFFFLKKKISL